MQKNSLIMPAIMLCIICLVTTGLVALTFVSTQAARDEQAAITANANRRQLCPEAVSFEEIQLNDEQVAAGLTEAFTAMSADGQAIAWLIGAQSKGYGGPVPVLAVIGLDGKIDGLKILDNSETPGLGKKVAGQSFFGQFLAQDVKSVFSVKTATDSQVRIDAVTGATISSRAVTNAVNLILSFYQQQITEVN
ncbi:MAG TPA: hypothetical protein DCM45_06815 [Clostridiales bacterium]|nr:hypothetical protein [Clostridiales bacterium]